MTSSLDSVSISGRQAHPTLKGRKLFFLSTQASINVCTRKPSETLPGERRQAQIVIRQSVMRQRAQ